MIARSDELELAGLSAGTQLGAPRARRRARAGVAAVALADPDAAARARRAELDGRQVLAGEEGVRELIARTEPDLVLNAIVGSAGLGPTIVALSEGIDLALANKESLVVGGELVTALAEATGARILPVDSEHSALFQLLARRAARARSTARPDRLRRAVPRPHRPRRRHPRGGARPPDLGDGRQDHDRLGDADEQGPRADRGPPPLRRPLRADRRRRPPAVDRPLAGRAQRRRPARPPRATPTCGCRSPTRCTSPSAPTSPCRGSTSPRSASSSFERARPRDLPLPAPGARGRGGRRDGALRAQRRQRGRRRRLPRRPDRRSPRSPR